jgi:alpha/beta superfamily hydrolase
MRPATVVAAYREAKYTTFRFNFRGIGQNAASYDQAIGGQADVRAALARVQGLGKTAVDLAGYSFGAWINAIGLESFDTVNRLIMVSPPVELLDFSPVKPSDKIGLIITGANDPLAPPAKLEKLLPGWNPRARLEVVAGTDHFFLGKTEVIRDIVLDFLQT